MQLTISTALITEALATDDDLKSLASSDCSRINDVANMEDVEEEEVPLPASNGIRNEDAIEIFTSIGTLMEPHSPSPVPSHTPTKAEPPRNIFIPKQGEETPYDYTINLEEFRKRLALSPETNLNNPFLEDKDNTSDELEATGEQSEFCSSNFENPSSPVENTLSVRYGTRNSKENSPDKPSEDQKSNLKNSVKTEFDLDEDDLKGYSIYERESGRKNLTSNDTFEITSKERFDGKIRPIEEEIIEEEEEEEIKPVAQLDEHRENTNDKTLSDDEIRATNGENVNKYNDSSKIQIEPKPFVNGNSEYTRESQNAQNHQTTPSLSNGVAAVENSRWFVKIFPVIL